MCPQEGHNKRNVKRAYFVPLSGRQNTWFLGPYSTKVSKAGRSEIGAARENQGPAWPQLARRAAISTKQERADPLTQIGPSLETQLIPQLYIIGNKLGQIKTGGAGAGGTHPQFSQKTE